MPVDKQMQSLVDGWYFADESFAQPGVYFWNGKENVHAQTELSTLRSDNNRLRAEYAALQESVTAKDLLIVSLKEQNALLAAQGQEGWKFVPVEPTADMKNAGIAYFREHKDDIFNSATHYQEMLAAAPALPQQVKSEDARDAVIVGTLHINEYREYDFVPADLITLERALPVGAYELTAAISAQEEKA